MEKITNVPEELINNLKHAHSPEKSKHVVKPDSAWHFKVQRNRLKHLTEHPVPFTNRAGTRDVSYLANANDTDSHEVPDTIIPSEFHIMKSKATIGLEYQDEEFTTKLKELSLAKQTEYHLRAFPSLKPSKRHDAIQLLQVLDEMLADAGVTEDKLAVYEKSVKTETDMKNLVELINKEQKIYDLVLHELIRQVTVECVQRGKLLSRIRQKYANLICSIPEFMKSIYNRSLSLEALEKRLALKLIDFKNRVESLASELSSVQQKEREATNETIRARKDLDDAVKEARRSADLLHEYQSLYEMQRNRLEKQVLLITEERDVWTNISFALALKVIDENNLTSCKNLQVGQTGWHQLAKYFISSMLAENDSFDFEKVTELTWV